MALSHPVGVIRPNPTNLKTINMKCFNSTWELFRQQWFALTKVVCVSQFPNDSNCFARRFFLLCCRTLWKYIRFRNFIDRFSVEFEWRGKLFRQALFLRVLCKTKDLQQSSIVSALNKIWQTRDSWSAGMNWELKGVVGLNEQRAHVAAWLVRMLIALRPFSSFSLWTFVSEANDDTSVAAEAFKVFRNSIKHPRAKTIRTN